ncbi:hypothetical protein [Pectobacterium versatile]|uniref:hypothetical protein n=1 Tax=Pectobacterium versatile TaxID=2488639 RepID=UPI001CC96661|nr:hypothetical protein [Pectobacterium versatile]
MSENPSDESKNEASRSVELRNSSASEEIRRMFVDETQVGRIVNLKQTPAKRAAFSKQHGVAHGIFRVEDDLQEKYRVGIFKPGTEYKAWVRYSSDTNQNNPDKNTTMGIGIKLFGVPGKKALEEDANATTLDFILQNTQVFFAAYAEEMVDFKAAAMSGALIAWLEANPEAAKILDEMESRTVESVLTEPLWSCVPFKFGENAFCKFKLAVQSVANPNNPPEYDAPDYLARDMQERLMNGEARLNFYVQLRTNNATQSVSSARSLWKENEAIPMKVATLTFPKQNIVARGQADYGESLSFNIWRTLPEMIPLGSIAEARKVIYRSSAQVRRNVNGQAIGEPNQPRLQEMPVYSSFRPTLQTPWAVGTTGNIVENFQGYAETIIPEFSFSHFGELTISTRDMSPQTVQVLKAENDINGVLSGMIVQVNNNIKNVGILRILLEKNSAKNIKFGLVSNSFSTEDKGQLTIKAFDSPGANAKLVADQVIISEENAVVYIEARGEETISLLTFHYTNKIKIFQMDNFVISYPEVPIVDASTIFDVINGENITQNEISDLFRFYDTIVINIMNSSWASEVHVPKAINSNKNKTLKICNMANNNVEIFVDLKAGNLGASSFILAKDKALNIKSTGSEWHIIP